MIASSFKGSRFVVTSLLGDSYEYLLTKTRSWCKLAFAVDSDGIEEQKRRNEKGAGRPEQEWYMLWGLTSYLVYILNQA